MNGNSNSRQNSPLITIGAFCVVVASLKLAKDILLPFALAILFSFLLEPLVRRMERLGLHRFFAVFTATFLCMAVVLSTGWIVTDQVADLSSKIPYYRDNLTLRIRSLRGMSGTVVKEIQTTAAELQQEIRAVDPMTAGEAKKEAINGGKTDRNNLGVDPSNPIWAKIVSPPSSSLDLIQDTLRPLIGPLSTAGIVIVLVIFMLVERGMLRDRLIKVIGEGRINETTKALDDATARVSRYLGTQLLINILYGTAIAVGLFALGIPNALLWGVLGCLMRFLPYVGAWITAAIPVALSFAFSTGWSLPLVTIALFLLIELIVNLSLEPLLYGRSTGISSLAIVISAVLWTWLWGGVGLLLATPLTVCVLVIGRHIPRLEFLNILLADEPALEPAVRVYQRLLAFDLDEAQAVLHNARNNSSLEATYQTLLLPALLLIQRDRARGQIDDEKMHYLVGGMRELIMELDDSTNQNNASDASAELSQTFEHPQVQCLPARSEIDELAGLMLVILLVRKGISAALSSPHASAERLTRHIKTDAESIVVISALPPSALFNAHYCSQQIAASRVQSPIIVGLWNDTTDSNTLKQRIRHQVSIVTSFTQALHEINQRLNILPNAQVA